MSKKPERIQLRRTKDWRLPNDAVNVARPGKFGNPFLVTRDRSQRDAVAAFRIWLTYPVLDTPRAAAMTARESLAISRLNTQRALILRDLPSLRGKDLACWCAPGTPCHADVLLELANMPEVAL